MGRKLNPRSMWQTGWPKASYLAESCRYSRKSLILNDIDHRLRFGFVFESSSNLKDLSASFWVRFGFDLGSFWLRFFRLSC